MPGLHGIKVAERVRDNFTGVRVIVFSSHSDSRHVRLALRAGAAGYLVKDGNDELATAVKTVAAGGRFFSPDLAPLSADELQRQMMEAPPVEILTPRQRQILQLIAVGHSTKEIAEKLAISVKTAETHRTELMNRLDIHDVAGLVRYAIRVGLATPEE
jgi:DNA-binding NarL/FixJ family response regulator